MSVTGWFNAAGDKSVTLTVEMGFGSADSTSLWNTALWNTTATWGSDIVWTDVTEYVMGFSTRSGRNRSVNQFDTGTATVTLRNTDARFSPWNLAGPYVTAGRTNIRPWRPIRISRLHEPGVVGIPSRQYLFYGYMTGFTESYSNNALNVVTVSCVDELGRLARFNGFEQTPQGAGETTIQRVRRILNNAGFTGNFSTAFTTSVTCQATTLSQNALTELKLTADTEGGWIYAMPNMRPAIMFKGRADAAADTRPPVELYDLSNTDPLAFKYTSFTQQYSGDLVATSAAVGRVGGTAQRYTDQSARALYGDLQYSRTDLVAESDAHCLSLARQRVDTHKDAEQLVTSITLRPRMGPHVTPTGPTMPQNMWVLAGTSEDVLLRRVNVTSRPPGMPSPVTGEYVVDSVQHDVTMDDWSVTWGLAPTKAFVTTAGLWSDGPRGWDSATWFY